MTHCRIFGRPLETGNPVQIGAEQGCRRNRKPAEDERRRLVWYLGTLANGLYHLPLRGIEQRLDHVRPLLDDVGDEADPLGGPIAGEVTSGTFSPTLKQGIGLALLDSRVSVGDEVVVDVRGRASRFLVAKPPFVSASTR